MNTLSPTFSIWMNAFRDFMPIVVVERTVVLVLIVLSFFGFMGVGELNILAGCLCYDTSLILALAKHVA